MKKFIRSVGKFAVSQDGPTAVEYGVMLSLIVVVCLIAINSIGNKTNSTFQTIVRSTSSGS